MKNLILAALTVATITACSKDAVYTTDGETQVTLHLQGDFYLTTHAFTRAIEADGKAMTDIWLFDYQDGVLHQQLHQTQGESDFGEPTITLPYGQHHIYAVISRGASPVIDSESHTIVWSKPLDTFYADYAVTVNANAPTTAAVTLDRVVTKLSIAPTDPIPTGTSRVDITPHTWYYGLDYMNGQPTAPSEDEPHSITIPSDYVGTATTFSIFGFSGATEWTTAVTVESYSGTNTETASVNIPSAPFKANRVTEYRGHLWSVGTGLTLTLNTEWSTPYQATW
jgi:hypothetical protein